MAWPEDHYSGYVADRREQKEALRAKRVERERAEAAGKRRRRLVVYVVAGVVALGAAGGAAALTLGGGDDGPATAEAGGLPDGDVPARKETNLQAAVKAAGCTLTRARAKGDGQHVEGTVNYDSRPPHSGPHNIVPAEDGAYAEAPKKENVVHALEHGRIVVQFEPEASDEVKGALKALFDEDPVHLLLVPDSSGMKFAVAATAWTDEDASGPEPSYGRLLGCPKVSPPMYDAIRAFRDSFRDRGPEYVP